MVLEESFPLVLESPEGWMVLEESFPLVLESPEGWEGGVPVSSGCLVPVLCSGLRGLRKDIIRCLLIQKLKKNIVPPIDKAATFYASRARMSRVPPSNASCSAVFPRSLQLLRTAWCALSSHIHGSTWFLAPHVHPLKNGNEN